MVTTLLALLAAAAVVYATRDARAGGDPAPIVVVNKAENVVFTAEGLRHNSPLYRTNGTVVGVDRGTCELLPPRGTAVNEYACHAVLSLPGGDVTVHGWQPIPAATAVSAITGGTGAFEGCEGSIVGVPYTATPDPADIKITIKLEDC